MFTITILYQMNISAFNETIKLDFFMLLQFHEILLVMLLTNSRKLFYHYERNNEYLVLWKQVFVCC